MSKRKLAVYNITGVNYYGKRIKPIRVFTDNSDTHIGHIKEGTIWIYNVQLGTRKLIKRFVNSDYNIN